MDRQIKIRGFRIEPGEIEAAIQKHEAVEQAIVIPFRSKGSFSDQITAYVKLKYGKELSAGLLRLFLSSKMPEYMVPNFIVFVDEIPLNVNGKIDYQMLLRKENVLAERQNKKLLPRDKIELELLKIWEEILELDDIGIRDNFFDLGGHSILAIQLMNSINERFSKKLPLAILLEYGTVEQLAGLIKSRGYVRKEGPIVTIQESSYDSIPVFFVHPAGGQVLCYYELSKSLGKEFSFYGLEAQTQSTDNVEDLCVSIYDLASHYLKFVGSFVEERFAEKRFVLGGWSMGAIIAFEMAQQISQKNHIFPLVAILDQHVPNAEVNSHIASDNENDDAYWLSAFAKKIEQLSGKKLYISYSELVDKGQDEGVRLFLNKLIINEILPSEMTVQEFNNFLWLQKIHNKIVNKYVPKHYPGNLKVFCSTKEVTLNNASYMKDEDDGLGWKHYVSPSLFEVESVPGTHITMVTTPNVQVLASHLREWIHKVY